MVARWFRVFFFFFHPLSHGGSTLAFLSGSGPQHKPSRSPDRGAGQELVLKRLWRSALHSPCGGVCGVLYTKTNIYSLYVQKSGPSCSAVWKRQVLFYLITAPRNLGDRTGIGITFTSAGHMSLNMGDGSP